MTATDRFNLGEWRSRLGVTGPINFRGNDHGQSDQLYGDEDLCAHSITSPIHLVALEDLRYQIVERASLSNGVPADVFAFALGEPTKPYVTKIGGLPYRPAGTAWPTFRPREVDIKWSLNERLKQWPPDWPAPPADETDLDAWPELPLTFLAQFWLGDSQGLVSDVPGSVLLVFVSDLTSLGEPGAYHFEWRNVDISELVQPEQVPSRAWASPVFHGYPHRTFDYDPAVFPPVDDFVTGGIKPNEVAVLGATKIGGISNAPKESPHAEFLCQLASVCPAFDRPYPWVNVPEPLQFDPFGRAPQLNLWDAGFVSFFLGPDGQVQPVFRCG